ncbi:MAG: hypothetical protein KDA83_19445, partial [Planctomycetales bacterium]|nr:hypothetical protein [Planctomycetales bacterium]
MSPRLPRQHEPSFRPGRRASRAGSLYLPVLATCLIGALLTSTVLMVVRSRRLTIDNHNRELQARLLAQAGLASARESMRANPNWRDMAVDGEVGRTVTYAEGSCDLRVFDPLDGDLTDDVTDPFVIQATGISGRSSFQLESSFHDQPQPVDSLDVDWAVGGSLTMTDAVLDGDGRIWAGGSVLSTNSSVAVDVAASGTVGGGTYLFESTGSVAPRTMPDPDSVYASLMNRATAINLGTAGTYSDNLCSNSDFETAIAPWSGASSVAPSCTLELDTAEAHGGNQSLLVTDRWWYSQGPEYS